MLVPIVVVSLLMAAPQEATDPGQAAPGEATSSPSELPPSDEAPSTPTPASSEPAPVGATEKPEPKNVKGASNARQRLLILDLEAVGVDANTVRVINGLVSQGLSRSTSLEVITSTDLGALVDLEAERAATGCEDTSCLAEIAGAMGTRFVVFGTAGKLGKLTIVQLNLFDSEAAKPVAREEVRAEDDSALADSVPAAAVHLVSSIVDVDDPIVQPRDVPVAKAPVASDSEEALGVLPIALFASGGAVAAVSVLAGAAGAAFFIYGTAALNNSAPATSDLRNGVFKPLGPFGAVVAGLGGVGLGVGLAVLTAGFFVE